MALTVECFSNTKLCSRVRFRLGCPVDLLHRGRKYSPVCQYLIALQIHPLYGAMDPFQVCRPVPHLSSLSIPIDSGKAP